ncbi:ASNSD1 upstream open reading frame protein-like [Apostichopus japonicus]|uniref:ASNSD1 upstream open reading frame protein-like n=1 Tax=Stichopus japonicus TaxID=307972 RepID=UPI003AB3A55C
MTSANDIKCLENKIEELLVVESELSSTKKAVKVYKQQPNSFVYFCDDGHQLLNNCRKQLKELKAELEKTKAENSTTK